MLIHFLMFKEMEMLNALWFDLLHVSNYRMLPHQYVFFLSFSFLVGLSFQLRASHLQSRCSATWVTPLVYFAVVILEMRSCELFAQAGLELPSLWAHPPKQLGLPVWATGTLLASYIFIVCVWEGGWIFHHSSWYSQDAVQIFRPLPISLALILFLFAFLSQ
jgi:hypothetical protein